MDEFLKMDVFFVIASLSILIVSALISFAVWRLLRILKHVERIAEIAGKEAENLRENASYIRGRTLGVLDGLISFIPRARKRKVHEGNTDAS